MILSKSFSETLFIFLKNKQKLPLFIKNH